MTVTSVPDQIRADVEADGCCLVLRRVQSKMVLTQLCGATACIAACQARRLGQGAGALSVMLRRHASTSTTLTRPTLLPR